MYIHFSSLFLYDIIFGRFLQNRIEYFLFLAFGAFFRMLGLKRSRRLSGILGGLFYYFIPIRKKTVIENLTKAFPEKNEKEIRRIAFNTYKSFLTTFIEILLMPYMSREEIENAVYAPEKIKKIILDSFHKDRGVILLSAHFGNWEYVAASVSAQVNEPFYVIVKSQRNPYVNDWMNRARTSWINKIVPLGISIREVFRQLKEKHIVAMVADQRGPSDGIRVTLLGRKASVYPGPAMLAVKTNAPVLFGVAIRQKDYSYKLELGEISTENLPEKDEEKIFEISQRHTDLLEKYIREYPEQWLWMHKRWKY